MEFVKPSDSLDILAQDIGKSLSLLEAVKTSCVPLVKLILQAYSARGNSSGAENIEKTLSRCLYEAVQMACKGGAKSLPMVKYLLDIGGNVNLYKSPQQNYLTPLHLVINTLGCQCQDKLVTLLLDAKVEVNEQNTDGYAILHYAIKSSPSIIEAIIEAGANPVASTQKIKAETPLHMACRRSDGSEPIIRLLINEIHRKFGPDSKHINCSRTDGWTPLHILTGERSPRTSDNLVSIAHLLLSNGADINLTTTSGETPLLLAIKPENDDLVKYLLSHNADIAVKTKDGTTVLHEAARSGNNEMFKLLLKMDEEHQLDINAQNSFGLTPLHVAVKELWRCQDVALFDTMIKSGADINAQDKDEFTPIHLLCDGADRGGAIRTLVLKMMLDTDVADLTLCDKRGKNTALHMAINRGTARCTEIVKILLKYETPINKLDGAGRNPLSHAVLKNNLEVVKILLDQKKIEIDCPCSDGKTALGIAAKHGFAELVSHLLLSGAGFMKDSSGYSPLHSAINEGFLAVVELLLLHGADINQLPSPLGMALDFYNDRVTAKMIRVLAEAGAYLDHPLILLNMLRIQSLAPACSVLQHGIDTNLHQTFLEVQGGDTDASMQEISHGHNVGSGVRVDYKMQTALLSSSPLLVIASRPDKSQIPAVDMLLECGFNAPKDQWFIQQIAKGTTNHAIMNHILSEAHCRVKSLRQICRVCIRKSVENKTRSSVWPLIDLLGLPTQLSKYLKMYDLVDFIEM